MKRGGFLLGCMILVCGLMWSNLALAKPPVGAACPPRIDCKESVVLAKSGFSQEPYCFACYAQCSTVKGCDDLIIRMKRKVTLDPKETLCDGALQCIPAGSIMDVDLTYHIRQAEPCAKPVGTHEGKFKITLPPPAAGGIGATIATGKMHGTNGLETHAASGECCAWPHDEGCMESKNVKCPHGTCKLIATYASNLDPTGSNPNDLCDPLNWTYWTLKIDGILLCPCP